MKKAQLVEVVTALLNNAGEDIPQLELISANDLEDMLFNLAVTVLPAKLKKDTQSLARAANVHQQLIQDHELLKSRAEPAFITQDELAAINNHVASLETELKRLLALVPADNLTLFAKALAIRPEAGEWAYIDITKTRSKFTLRFNKEFYDSNKELCYNFFARLKTRAEARGLKAFFNSDGLNVLVAE